MLWLKGKWSVEMGQTQTQIDEIWYFIGGQGEIWFREERDKGDGTTKEVRPGTCLTIPADVRF